MVFFLLLSGQKESLVGKLCDSMEHANAMVDVIAVKETNELVCHQDALLTDGADAVSN